MYSKNVFKFRSHVRADLSTAGQKPTANSELNNLDEHKEDKNARDKIEPEDNQRLQDGIYKFQQATVEEAKSASIARNDQIKLASSESAEQIQTTWEREKLKADQIARLRQTEMVDSNRKLMAEDGKVESNLDATNDSSIANMESLPSLEVETWNGSSPAPGIVAHNVTPETMTAAEAENLLSSR